MPRQNDKILYKGERYALDDPSLPDGFKEAIADRDRAITDRSYRNNPVARAAAVKAEATAPAETSQGQAAASAETGNEGNQATTDKGTINNVPEALPSDFPAFQLLSNAGYTSLDAIMAASDEDLLKIRNLGEATLADIRKATEEA